MRIENGYIISEGKLIHVLALYYNDVGLIEYGDSEYMYQFNRLFIKRANGRGLAELLDNIRFVVLDYFDIYTQFHILKFIINSNSSGTLIDVICSSDMGSIKELLDSYDSND